jgi:DNA-directed RNA polymerase III subunit RPC11
VNPRNGREGLTSRVCPTCPYKWIIAQRISMRTHLKRKEVDDVLGGKEAWANVDSVEGKSECSSHSTWSSFA